MSKPDQLSIPGLEEYSEFGSDLLEFHEGIPEADPRKYFDASLLDDAPAYQPNARNTRTFMLYVVFPDWESFRDGIRLLTGGKRKGLAKSARYATLSSIAPQGASGLSMVEFWRKHLPDDGGVES